MPKFNFNFFLQIFFSNLSCLRFDSIIDLQSFIQLNDEKLPKKKWCENYHVLRAKMRQQHRWMMKRFLMMAHFERFFTRQKKEKKRFKKMKRIALDERDLWSEIFWLIIFSVTKFRQLMDQINAIEKNRARGSLVKDPRLFAIRKKMRKSNQKVVFMDSIIDSII